MSRELSNWLTGYLEFADNTESPVSYHTWCGLGAIAGALQRKVYLKWGHEVIYPNLYTVLIGPSGRTRKGTALGIAKSILKQVPGVTIAPESSPGKQATIMVMKRAGLDYVDPTDNKTKRHCSVTAFSEELSVFLGQGDIAYLSSLTDWYDSKDDWEYESITRGKDTIKGVCFNLVGGTAPDWIQSMIPHEAVGGGFTSRVIFIVEEAKRQIVPEHTMTVRELALEQMLVHDLERIQAMKGEMEMSQEAKKMYVDWYIEQNKNTEAGHPAVDDPRFAGYNERRATHLRKLLLVASASRGDDLLIIGDDFNMARQLLEGAEINMHKTFGGFGKSRTSDATETVKNFIQKMGITTRKMVLQYNYRDMDVQSLTIVEETLRQMGVIRIDMLPKSNDKQYTWIGECKDDTTKTIV